MTEIHQRRHRGKIGERQPVADKEARRGNRAFQIVEQLRQFLRLCLRSRGEIAFAPQKARRDDAVEESGRAHVELQALMRISYAVLSLKQKERTTKRYHSYTTHDNTPIKLRITNAS